MWRNLILVLALIVMASLAVNGFNRLSSFKGNSNQVGEAQSRLDELKKENEQLKQELQYKSTDRFAEEEIRDKLGLTKEGETEVIIPKDEKDTASNSAPVESISNPRKWENLFLGRG